MRVCVISNDEALRQLLHEVSPVPFEAVLPGQPPGSADLYIWDREPGVDELALSETDKHLFLVGREMLHTLEAKSELGPVCLLLKPVNGVTLRSFIELAEAKWRKSQEAAEVNALRSERDALLQYLLQTNLRLQEYDQDRTNFLARALHDLRAPLTALQGYCGLMMEGRLGAVNPQQQELLKRMEHSARRLSRLVCGMFELSVKGRVVRKLRLEQADIEHTLNQALYDVSPFVQEKHLNITTRMDSAPHRFVYDPEQVEQVLVNLLENACKFTPRHGSIEICGYCVDSVQQNKPALSPAQAAAYRIDIRDSGPGIDPSRLSSIFEEYTSYSGPMDRSGAGLGLAICKLLVHSHSGRIWVNSSGDGAEFSIVLPFEPVVAAAHVADDALRSAVAAETV
jgi:signal transduction histidine kinase